MSDLKVRLIAGLAMAAVALGLLWLGGVAFLALGVIICALVLREWCGITGAARSRVAYRIALTLLAASFGLGGSGRWEWALALVVIGGLAMALWGVGLRQRAARWTGLGLVYAAVPGLALVWLRGLPDGFLIVLWLMVAVALTDTFAYFAGRRFGGPKLAPRISPKKTWSGLIGGMAGAALGGWVIGALFGLPLAASGALAGAAAVLAVVAQAGDLAESALKRAFDVKDSGSILPGHGGIMDRVDGLIAAAPVVALAELVGLGIGAIL
ncbi:phosphatidate cytidylyltransferase [Pedomonas mirosovicensis]|uniref:phosphatidate cytidylyltransferase n=1 Tax=Pedomonas mirosovicensis TaxID=2908641 RepID=UPI00216A1B32|nr:phosphatidate cytidylyltransferase [Pedomonas mirosovicensis]MCH8685405.1 phosphatidate cytidylyltransferase [Pedomonas mirosovicensis]